MVKKFKPRKLESTMNIWYFFSHIPFQPVISIHCTYPGMHQREYQFIFCFLGTVLFCFRRLSRLGCFRLRCLWFIYWTTFCSRLSRGRNSRIGTFIVGFHVLRAHLTDDLFIYYRRDEIVVQICDVIVAKSWK